MNQVFLSGRLGGDIELKSTTSGKSVGSANIAVDSFSGGEKKTEWWALQFWGEAAENAARLLSKGRKVLVSGRLSRDSWEKDGQKHEKTRIVVNQWEFADSGKSDAMPAKQPASRRNEGHEDDIPF